MASEEKVVKIPTGPKVETTPEVEEKSEDQKKLEAYAADIEAVNVKHGLRIVSTSRLEVAHLEEKKPVLDPV